MIAPALLASLFVLQADEDVVAFHLDATVLAIDGGVAFRANPSWAFGIAGGAGLLTGLPYDYPGFERSDGYNDAWCELLSGSAFVRWAANSHFEVDAGVRYAWAMSNLDIVVGGRFLGPYVALFVGWDWIKLGTRVVYTWGVHGDGEGMGSVRFHPVLLRLEF